MNSSTSQKNFFSQLGLSLKPIRSRNKKKSTVRRKCPRVPCTSKTVRADLNKCNVCQYEASNRGDLRRHVYKAHACMKAMSRQYNVHNDKFDPLYFCMLCKKSFASKEYMNYHTKHVCQHHTKPAELPSSNCKDSLVQDDTRTTKPVEPVLLKDPKSTLVNFKRSQCVGDKNHIMFSDIASEQLVDRSIKCFRCNIYFKTHKLLKNHLECEHGEELRSLHVRTTTKLLNHKCTGCSLTFRCVRDLTRHRADKCSNVLQHTRVEEHEDSNEDSTSDFTSHDNMCDPNDTPHEVLVSNVATVDVFHSDDTSDAKLLTYLQEAASKSHHDVSEIASVQVQDRSARCIRCNIKFQGHKALQKHLERVHHQELEHLRSNACETTVVLHKCSRCASSFSSVRMLTKHYSECEVPPLLV